MTQDAGRNDHPTAAAGEMARREESGLVQESPAGKTSGNAIAAAEVVLPCRDLDETLEFFTTRLDFRLEAIFPADHPSVAVIAGHGVRLRLCAERAEAPGAPRLQGNGPASPGVLRLRCHDVEAVAGGAQELTAPNGTRIELVEADPAIRLPPLAPSFVVTRLDDAASWVRGRAGMLYRDLIPDRQGGRFVASHIRIPAGGPVPDYVHFHHVRFQMIYCYKGWVRVVYEDQGPPLTLQAGDCVLQPPRIRHRVLACSPGLEVIEIGSPAEHETFADHVLALPTPDRRPERVFSAQTFVHHRAAEATWAPWRVAGFTARDIGVAAATSGLAGVQVARRSEIAPARALRHEAEFVFLFVLAGSITLHADGHDSRTLSAGDAFVVPARLTHRLADASADVELLEVTLPATFPHVDGVE
ncbi:MAG: cupin domain-containing protein [Acidobacteriota bacterium]